mmetsp:Transcript_36093/g.83130  ORF Transcript_36093/g.83130 Transcript_36093/m.83130 type:complete len:419 (-) Transcript_36093:101-1357(-)
MGEFFGGSNSFDMSCLSACEDKTRASMVRVAAPSHHMDQEPSCCNFCRVNDSRSWRLWLSIALILSLFLSEPAKAFNILQAQRRPYRTVVRAQAGPKKATAQEPWKPLVFKMPQKKPPRKLEPGDDDFTMKMRDRLKAIKAKEGDEPDDLITISTENAKNLALSAMWYIDQDTDRKKAEKTNPDAKVLRQRYERALAKLELPEELPSQPQEAPVTSVGKVEIGRSIDDLYATSHSPSSAGSEVKQREVPVSEKDAEDEGVADFLANLQRRNLRKNGQNKQWIKKRIVKSPEDRRKDYEDTKVRMFGITAALGGLGTAYAFIAYSASIAFSFGLGSIGGLLYLSGLSSYTDNAENPMGAALGARRLLTPVVVLLIVQGWPRIEAQVPQLADLHLQPALLPAILGFFIYTIGKVLAGLVQ